MAPRQRVTCHTERLRNDRGRLTAGTPGGFTLVELLVAIAVIGLLAAVLLPAVQHTREAARHTQCRSNLHQIGVAIQAHETARGTFPRIGFTFDLLPYIDQENIHQLWPEPLPADLDVNEISALLADLDQYQIPLYLCPSDAAPRAAAGRTNYVGNVGSGVQTYGFNGFFSLDRGESFRPADFIRRGLSNTAAVSETLGPFGDETPRLRTVWQLPRLLACPDELDEFAETCERLPRDPSGRGYRGVPGHGTPWHGKSFANGIITYNHILPPNRPHCTNRDQGLWACLPAKSAHPGGASVLYGDGRVDFVSETVDRHVWRETGSRVPLDEAVPFPPARCATN